MAEQAVDRLIKRYAGVRFYDVDAASYVSIEEVASLLRAREIVHVVDAPTGQDVARAVLAQVPDRRH
jgi:polyhydroxyalkanoate synthesis regulator protein